MQRCTPPPSLELLEERSLPSALGVLVSQQTATVQHLAEQAGQMHSQFSVYWGLLGNAVNGGFAKPATQNAVGSLAAFFAEQSYADALSQAAAVDRLMVLGGLAAGLFGPEDLQAVLSAWSAASNLPSQATAAYQADLALFNGALPDGFVFPVAGGASLATIYPHLND